MILSKLAKFFSASPSGRMTSSTSKFDNFWFLMVVNELGNPKFKVLLSKNCNERISDILNKVNLVTQGITKSIEVSKFGSEYLVSTADGFYTIDSLDHINKLIDNLWVTGSYEDKEGLMWLSTLNDGVYLLSDQTVRSTKIEGNINEKFMDFIKCNMSYAISS